MGALAYCPYLRCLKGSVYYLYPGFFTAQTCYMLELTNSFCRPVSSQQGWSRPGLRGVAGVRCQCEV